MGHAPTSLASQREEQSQPEKQQLASSGIVNSTGKKAGAGSDAATIPAKSTVPHSATAHSRQLPLAGRELPEAEADDCHASTDVSSFDGDKTSTTSVNTYIPPSDGQISMPNNKAKGQPVDSSSSDDGPAAELEDSKEAARVELREAPVPPVNIWQQRREAQLAKARPTLALPVPTAAPNGPLPGPLPDENKPVLSEQRQRQGGKHTTDKEPLASGVQASQGSRPRKGDSIKADGDPGRGNTAPRSVKMADRDVNATHTSSTMAATPITTAPPSVDDATLWPSLDGASERKSSDKADRPLKKAGDDGAGSRQRAKGWLAVDLDYRKVIQRQPHSSRVRGGIRGGTRIGQPQNQAHQSHSQAHGQAQASGPPSESVPGTTSPGKASTVAVTPEPKVAADSHGVVRNRECEKDQERGMPADPTAPTNLEQVAPTSRRSTGDGLGGKEGRKSNVATGTAERSKDLPLNGALVSGYPEPCMTYTWPYFLSCSKSN